MRVFFAFSVVAVLASIGVTCETAGRLLSSVQPLYASPIVFLRAGAKQRRGSSRRSGSTKRSLKSRADGDDDDADDDDNDSKQKQFEDDGDDEDDEDDEQPRKKIPSQSKRRGSKAGGGKLVVRGKGKGKGKKRKHRNQLAKWGETYGKASAGLREGLREKIEELAKQGQTAYKDVYRRAKVLRSSAFEAMLLRATWPGDEAVPQDLLDEIIKHSIPAFKYGRSSSEDDPYHMTMHKLWTKMCEKDWRTVVKSLYIVHCISRDCSVDSCSRFSMAIKDMSKVRNPKSPDHKYFDAALIKDVDDSSAPYESFVSNYAAYVLFRSKTFCSKFEELKEVSDQTHEKQAVARLKRAQTCMQNGLKCVVDDRDQQNVITGHATRQICNDLRDCWKQFTAKLAPLVGGEGVAAYGGARAEEKDIVALLQFYKEAGKDIKAYLAKAIKAYGPLRVKIPSEIESKFLPPADFEERLANRTALLTASVPPPGGASSDSKGRGKKPTAGGISASLDDEDAMDDGDDDDDADGGKDDEDENDADDEDEDDEDEDEEEEEEEDEDEDEDDENEDEEEDEDEEDEEEEEDKDDE